MAAYLFDLDGTLADTIPIILTAARRALVELRREDITDSAVKALIGVPLIETGEILLGAGEGEHYREVYQRHFKSVDTSGLRSFPGIEALLRELVGRGGKLAVVTSKRYPGALETLEQLGLRNYFQVLVTAESCAKHKPDPEPAYYALKQLQAEEEPAVLIGDSVFDIGCGKNAGLTTCGVTWGAETAERLGEAGADYIVNTVAELRSVLL